MGAALELPPLLGGRYRITRRLGQGSIAQVVAARDQRDPGGPEVALKILYPNLQQNEVVADRFRREVQVVRRIEHPHVARIHDLVEADGLLFLVMELHLGGDLADRLASRGRLPLAELRLLARQLCGALEAAHRAGVVHRDVKPQNVLVGPDPVTLDTRLCDFGLARTADLAGLTTRATVLGTPEYMAPEAISDGYADPRSDLYSLGVMLYQAATGALPFRGDSPYQLLRQHLTAAAPRARLLAPELPEAIDEAIARALSKEPLDRFASAADLLVALDTESTALVVRGPAAPAPRLVCRRCGGAVVEGVRTCVDCGESSLRARTERGGRAVLVIGPGEPADKIDGRSHVALVRLLEELPPGTTGLDELRKQPPRLPFYVATDLDEASADELAARLTELGFEARVEPGVSLWKGPMRAKVWRMARRYTAMTMAVGWVGWFQLGKALHNLPVALAVLGLAALVPSAIPAVLFRRPLVRLPGAAPEEDAAQARLAATLGNLGRREDRRLVARILDRLPLCERLGAAGAGERDGGFNVTPHVLLAQRAATAAEGLAALEKAGAHLDEGELQRAVAAGQASDEVSGALDRLRESERLRALLVADLLRTFSRLDLLCLKLARVQALEGQARMTALAAELDELRAQLAAEEDLTALLGSPS